jgi:hypothetical protein
LVIDTVKPAGEQEMSYQELKEKTWFCQVHF